jgi:hypothetical protein
MPSAFPSAASREAISNLIPPDEPVTIIAALCLRFISS